MDITVNVIIMIKDLALKPLKKDSSVTHEEENRVQKRPVSSTHVQWRLSNCFCENVPVLHILIFLQVFLVNVQICF